MKYQKLENLEYGWKWKYLVKKHHEGVPITKYLEKDLSKTYIDELFLLENQPKQIQQWIKTHLNLALDQRLKQAIRAKRKRYFNAEQQHSRKKSIDLEFIVWQQLSVYAKQQELTLSDAIIQLIGDAKIKENYVNQMLSLKNDLQKMLIDEKKDEHEDSC